MSSFATFFHDLHGERSTPRLWQTRAAEELSSSGWWPALKAPTGAGKTTLIECWLYALAQSGPDRLGRRLVWVVDRRSVVDQVFVHADRVVNRLGGDVLDRLKAIGGGSTPVVRLWRGGLDDEASIAMRDPLDPAQIAIVVSTVDQFGSRLLFRGYGLGAGSRAMHAGLLGLDTTVVLDEAHLSGPLRETVRRVGAFQDGALRRPRPALRLCPISATHDRDGAFELLPEELAEAGMRAIVQADKHARLLSGRAAVRKLVDEFAADGAKVIGVVMNTVADARAVFDRLSGDKLLLIGPIRPLDREGLIERIPGRPEREDRERPFVVVATQTIEVGVDLDFDALITACASVSALVQRFGRLDRRGHLRTTKAVVLAPPARGCPVYGGEATAAWTWLQSMASEQVVNVGIHALAEAPPRPVERKTPIVRLLAHHVDALSVTDGLEDEGPSIELLLHGNRDVSPEVSVIWRALAEDASDAAVELDVQLRPPHRDEILTLSLNAVRRWLLRADTPQLSDVEAVEHDEVPSGRLRRAWRLEGVKLARVESARDVRPGDRVVVLSAEGGADRYGWAPLSGRPVDDLGSLAARAPRLLLGGGNADLVRALESGEPVPADRLEEAIDAALEAHRREHAERVADVKRELLAGSVSLLDDGRILVTGRAARSELGGAGGVVPLEAHQARVREVVVAAATAIGLDDDVARSLERAALHHDEGKRDRRFQDWLKGGRPVVEDVAKSVYRYDRQRVTRLREAANWPAGKRHELLPAVAMIAHDPANRLDPWLSLTHHGLHRPFPESVDDDVDESVEIMLDGRTVSVPANAVPPIDWQLQTFTELKREFGTWGLAYLEALLVSADRRVSAHERGKRDG